MNKPEEATRYNQTWSGEYKRIHFEVCHWVEDYMLDPKHSDVYPNKGIWNSYIFINKKSIPKEFDSLIPKLKKGYSKRKYHDYYTLEYLFDFKGGATYFELSYNESGEVVGFKIGNDYNHIWSGGEGLYSITQDIKNSIDCFIDHFPKYKAWSIINGHWIIADNLEKYNDKVRQKR